MSQQISTPRATDTTNDNEILTLGGLNRRLSQLSEPTQRVGLYRGIRFDNAVSAQAVLGDQERAPPPVTLVKARIHVCPESTLFYQWRSSARSSRSSS